MKDDTFAKLFETEEGQVLCYNEYDPDTDITTIHQITLIDGVTVHAKIDLNGDKQEFSSMKYLDNFNQEKADLFRNKMIEQLQ